MSEAFIKIIVERLKAYANENDINLKELDFDIDDFEFLSLGDVINALKVNRDFDPEAFTRQIFEQFREDNMSGYLQTASLRPTSIVRAKALGQHATAIKIRANAARNAAPDHRKPAILGADSRNRKSRKRLR